MSSHEEPHEPNLGLKTLPFLVARVVEIINKMTCTMCEIDFGQVNVFNDLVQAMLLRRLRFVLMPHPALKRRSSLIRPTIKTSSMSLKSTNSGGNLDAKIRRRLANSFSLLLLLFIESLKKCAEFVCASIVKLFKNYGADDQIVHIYFPNYIFRHGPEILQCWWI